MDGISHRTSEAFIDSGKYTKERREELSQFIWDYIQSPDETQLEERLGELLAEFREPERLYLKKNWEPDRKSVV